MPTLVLLRHGQSQWNLENRFTGWVDVPLSERGVVEARRAGELLQEGGYDFDIVYTSVLKRAIKTAWLAMEAMDRMWLPVRRSWRINERMYGGLQGLNKAETAEKHGKEQVHTWRRSYATPPPPLDPTSELSPTRDRRYADVPADQLPDTECLKDTVNRFLPYWNETIAPAIRDGQRVLIVAHGNSLRALIKHLDNVSDDDIVGLNIPTGIPLVYELDDDLKPTGHRYLGDEAKAAEAAASVAAESGGKS